MSIRTGLTPVRREVLGLLLPDIALLDELTGVVADWKGDAGRGEYRSRRAQEGCRRTNREPPASR
jgi:hypothetical protein